MINDIQSVKDRINSGILSLEKRSCVGGRDLYVIKRSVESFVVLKEIQNDIKNAYNLKLSSRFEVLNQVTKVLEDGSPKVVVVTDLKQFHESIPQDRILSRLKNEAILHPLSLDVISKVLDDYRIKSGSVTGLPRGVGFSMYLAELYLKDVDDKIKNLPGVVSYSRFVDDMFIVFSSPWGVKRDYLKEIKDVVEAPFGLEFNEQKTCLFDLTRYGHRQVMNYLGYQISFGNAQPINIRITARKLDKYKKRIDLTFESYLNFSKINEKKARKVFVKRIRFLTGNTRLLNDGNVLAGIYFSNSFLNDISDLTFLDQYLTAKIEALIHLPQLKDRLKKFSYIRGFQERRFSPFSTMDLNKIIEIWKNEV